MNYQQEQIQRVIDDLQNKTKSDISGATNQVRIRITSFYESTKTINITLAQLKQIQEILK